MKTRCHCGAPADMSIIARREEVIVGRRLVGFREVGGPLERVTCTQGHDRINGVNVHTTRGIDLLKSWNTWKEKWDD